MAAAEAVASSEGLSGDNSQECPWVCIQSKCRLQSSGTPGSLCSTGVAVLSWPLHPSYVVLTPPSGCAALYCYCTGECWFCVMYRDYKEHIQMLKKHKRMMLAGVLKAYQTPLRFIFRSSGYLDNY